ncbi:hypothetical protein SVIO_032660 [Streptomyces violaceusniger]|uniref:Uncharacterized protein n=1 Tax=Streptomyces violaceusniger TaxID=68280 RepID=A0A4D4L3S2_STRVO|nr:hypothetical protein SVIO_032660 [Streptomyces violaceusniger]
MVGGPDPVPLVPDRHQRVGRQVVRPVGAAEQQMGEAGQLGVVPLEEVPELGLRVGR